MSETIQSIDLDSKSFRRRNIIKYDKYIQTEQIQTDDLIQNLEKDLNKLRVENIKLNKALSQAQENLTVYGQNQNNTSSGFMLPSEFKQRWENMVKDSIPNLFISLCEQPLLLVITLQSSMLFLQEQYQTKLTSKLEEVSKIFGISAHKLKPYLIKILQDHCQETLPYEDNLASKYINWVKIKLTSIVQGIPKTLFTEEIKILMNDWLEQIEIQDFTDWINQLWTLLAFINLSEQDLSFGFKNIELNFTEYKKSENYLIDGFGKEGSKSLVILPHIKRQGNQIYHPIKSVVLILSDKFKNLEQELQEISFKSLDIYSQVKQGETQAQETQVVQDKQLVQEQNQSKNNDSEIKYKRVVIQTDEKNQPQENQKPLSQRYLKSKIIEQSKDNQDHLECRIKPLLPPRRSIYQEMKDTLQLINSKDKNLLHDDQKNKESDRYYMQRLMRAQNYRVEENSSFINKTTNELAGKIIHQKSFTDHQSSLQVQKQIRFFIIFNFFILCSQHKNQDPQIKTQKIDKSSNKENLNNPSNMSIVHLMNQIKKQENTQTTNIDQEQRNSLEKLMKSFCLSQRNQGFKEWQHKRAQSNEQKNSLVVRKSLNKESSDEEDQVSFIRDSFTKTNLQQKQQDHTNKTTKCFSKIYERQNENMGSRKKQLIKFNILETMKNF